MSDHLTEKYQQQLDEKTSKVRKLLSSFYSSDINIYASQPTHFRMRAEFRIWHEGADTYHIMFNKVDKEQYRVDQLEAASEIINTAMTLMTDAFKGNEILRRKLFQVDYLSTLTDKLLITLVYHKALDDTWEAEVNRLKASFPNHLDISFIGRSKKQKVMLDHDFVIEELPINNKTYQFKQIENSFTQPNARVNCNMIEWSMAQVRDQSRDLLELYCGSGNFSVPLASCFKNVLATEISKTSVNAAQFNIATNNIDNLAIVRLSSEEFVEAMAGARKFRRLQEVDLTAYDFSTVLVDPPRAGIDDKTIALIQQFDNIIYISCNPLTLADNLQTLCLTHEIKSAAVFDQFPFTEHIESGVYLERKL
ncbi:MAG: tRNA (uracil-5-)-methyltransferase [Gammaproteobacteria bacterium]|jgi:tRNA (uracil-5-)-methyltransferase